MVNLIEKHMSLKGTSRLSVLAIAAAYQSAEEFLGEKGSHCKHTMLLIYRQVH